MGNKKFNSYKKNSHISEIECSYCKKIFIPNILLDVCNNHFCDECVNFWLMNIATSQIISAEEICFVQKAIK